LAAAVKAWTFTKTKFLKGTDGWSTSANEDYSMFEGCSQTALMHCFEALLAMYESTNSSVLEADATSLADFILDRLWREPGYVAEEYDSGWSNPIPFDGMRTIEPGHIAKWAFLFSEATRLGLPRRYLITGQRLFDYVQTYAYDTATSTTIDPTTQQIQGVWQQAEYLRMLIRYADMHSRSIVWPVASQSQQWIKREGIEYNGNGWIEMRSTDKGDAQRSMIHPLGMYIEGIRFVSEQMGQDAVDRK
jgi:mannose/cellobiose epimerase-like protein (N-acyl-D-glucosamine 2-epimerase family)